MTRPPKPVAEEIRQRRPFPSREAEALVALFRTTDRIHRLIESVVDPHGITLQQYNVLRILRGAGAEGLPTLTIAERMIERAPGITRLIDRLEARGLVERHRSEEDRRQVVCRISDEGLAVLAALDRPVDDADRRAFEALDASELTRFISLLDRVRAGLPATDAGDAS